MSKLYTEEQVIAGFTVFGGVNQDHAKKVVELLDPIQLPTDEEIENNAYSDRQVDHWEHEQQIGFQRGAKWMRDKIKGGRHE